MVLRVTGGTHVAQAPPVTYLAACLVPRLRAMGAACTVALRYNSETREAGFEIWLYQPGTEEDEEGIAVEMTPQGEITDAAEGFG